MKNFPVILKCQNDDNLEITILTVMKRIGLTTFHTAEFGKISIIPMVIEYDDDRKDIRYVIWSMDISLSESQYKLIAD
jgi:hypothetical protein